MGVFFWIGDADVCEFNVQVLERQIKRINMWGDGNIYEETDETMVTRKLPLTWSTEWRVPQMLKVNAQVWNGINVNVLT